jgi:hypothetical protein
VRENARASSANKWQNDWQTNPPEKLAMSYLQPAPAAPLAPRHALGLPAGSVRALLALGVLGVLWALAVGAEHQHKLPLTFVYLMFLMMLILAHYFAAHGNSIGKKDGSSSALGLPRGTIRFLLLAGYLGLAWFLFKERGELDFDTPPKADLILFLALILTGFFVGHLLTVLVRWLSGGTLPPWFQDIQAWLSILSLVGLGVLVLIHVFINDRVDPAYRIGINLDVGLATLVSFYFGARS